MMKKIKYIVLGILLVACNSEDANDCFQKHGNTIRVVIETAPFEKILVNRNIELILKEGSDYHVSIETGNNLINDIKAVVVSNELRLTDDNICNFVRDYSPTKVYVTAPNITEIRSSTQFDITSDGTLTYNSLVLISEDFNVSGSFTVGDFRFFMNNDVLRIASNNMSSFYISGEVNNVFVNFFSGAGRFEGANLIAQNVDVYHRGSNDMIINPQQVLSGELLGTGDLISLNQPPTIEVEVLYTGQLIFY